ncbi:MAG TPA: ABC transporter permease [Desulfosporosinus sp.]|nr:ABC transporter permease [Desulfosporosinus sp.]
MGLLETIKLASEGIWFNKMRSLLTMLGIIIGTATIILVMAVGTGSSQSVNNQFSQMSVTTIYVMPNKQSNPIPSKLSIRDVDAIKEKTPSVAAVAPQITGNQAISSGTTTLQASISGVNEEYRNLTKLKFSSGAYFSQDSLDNKEKVVVLGADIAVDLFGNAGGDYVGQIINIKRQKFTVVGIIERKGSTVGNTDIDNSAFIPYTTAQAYILGTLTTPRLILEAKDLESVSRAMAEVTTTLREAHKLRSSMSDDFMVKDAGSNLAAAQGTAHTMSILLIAVAAIVLVVGGIGIMNVMLVSVRERIKEIGTRRALGARKKDILRQFLFEAIGISFLGGIVGVGLGETVIPVLKYFDVESVRSFQGILISFAFSGIVGIFFGFYPARKAADSNPIEALRYE